MARDLCGEISFTFCVDELLHVLDIYGETYLYECVESEVEAFKFTQDVKDFRLAVRLAVAVALHHLSGDLRECLCQDLPKKTTADRLVRSISKLNMLL